jgi:hypothetical protein
MESEFEDAINDRDDTEYNEENEDFDIDHIIDDYEGQNTEIDNSAKIAAKNNLIVEDDDEELMDLIQDDENDFEKKFTTNTSKNYKKQSGYNLISSFEYAKLYSLLTEYIVTSKISIPKEMENNDIVTSGDGFRIAKYWLDHRKEFPIPMDLVKKLHSNIIEYVNPNNLDTHDDLSFHDDFHDEHRFDFNFHDEPYDTAA